MKCEKCGLVLKNKISLQSHYRRVHNDKNEMVICPICSQILKNNSSLQSHYRTIHKMYKSMQDIKQENVKIENENPIKTE